MDKRPGIRVPTARWEQINKIREARGFKTINDLIAFWVAQEIEQGTIAADVPGVVIKINTADRRGEMTLGELKLNPTSDEAKELSRAIRQIAAGHQSKIETEIARVVNMGKGFLIESLAGAGRYTANPAVAVEIADQIDREITTTK